jgi:hypothetical protein
MERRGKETRRGGVGEMYPALHLLYNNQISRVV